MTKVWPHMQKNRNLMSKWLIWYLQNCSLGLHFATILYNPWQATSSLSLITPSGGKKQQQKILGTHSVLAKACVGELPTWAKLSLASKKKLADSEAYDSLSLCFPFLSESENHINLQNSCTFSNAILFMPLKASRSTIRFPVKIQLGFQFNFRVISGELKDPRDLWYCENKKHL